MTPTERAALNVDQIAVDCRGEFDESGGMSFDRKGWGFFVGEIRDKFEASAGAQAPATLPKLTVWYGQMPESNGKTNWTAILHRGDVTRGITLDMSEYPDRVRYEADRMRWMIGELDKEPWILDYDADKHSGYVAPTLPAAQEKEA